MIIPWQRYADDHARTVDTMSAVLLFAVFLFGGEIGLPGIDQPDTAGPTIVLAALACGALLLWQRTRPRVAVAATACCTAAATALGHLITPLLLGPLLLALYRLAVHTDRRTVRRHYVASLALIVPTALILDPVDHPWVMKTISPVVWLLFPVVTGTLVRLQRAYVEAVQARAEYAEHGREEEARHRVVEERMRIARELHDVVAHHLALANAQAGTAAHLARTHPDRVQGILTDLTGTTSSALRELKATVGLLRQAEDGDSPLAPSPGLGQLSELTETCASTGLEVQVVTEGTARPLTPGVDLTAYRIVQEALTNVTRHAGARTARVRLAFGRDQLTITVCDDGAAVPSGGAGGGGFGLIGMRERAQSMGGAFQAGHRPEGGFEVTARLPLYAR
ncbi:histidine kinase [Streptomyces sp. NBC_01275]|uniref:sensor histidine kinase n=1 Tax=Streptomyces sp. NBC_01275 TaxID=2903807 RepID=UPI0022550A3D|nr:histidine kinase [Streptomyces sp. NBC_01275]MCX4767596.1 histidine kinase [Streptomyces sp. NBC_01275]